MVIIVVFKRKNWGLYSGAEGIRQPVGLLPEKLLASKLSGTRVQTYNLGNWARTRQGGIGSTIHEPIGHYGGGSGQGIYFGEVFLVEGLKSVQPEGI